MGSNTSIVTVQQATNIKCRLPWLIAIYILKIYMVNFVKYRYAGRGLQIFTRVAMNFLLNCNTVTIYGPFYNY